MVKEATKDQRQQLILDAAQQLIATQGLAAVSMANLASKTSLSRPAIYQYFASLEHVLAELVINEMADLSNAIDDHLRDFNDPLERVRIWVHYSLAHLSTPEHRAITKISIEALPSEERQLIKDLHGHFMFALVSPLTELKLPDVTATCNLIFASVAAAAKNIDEGKEFTSEAKALEQFVISGIKATLASKDQGRQTDF